jgi:transposase
VFVRMTGITPANAKPDRVPIMDIGELLLPGPGLRLRGLTITPDIVAIRAEPTASMAICPGCLSPSGRVHGRYLRTVADLPCQGRRLMLRLLVRRFRCPNAACPKRTFTERLQSVAPYARATARLSATQQVIGFALGGEAGARLAVLTGTPTSPDTLLRRIRQAERVEPRSPRVLGVDDFAFRKGQTYGTILVDLESRCVVDLLPDREASTVAGWLHGHPGVEVVSRDRASAYSQAAREAAPDAMQVADRWHLLSNMRDALERYLHQRSMAIRDLLEKSSSDGPPVPVPAKGPASAIDPPTAIQEGPQRTREARFGEVRRLHGGGHSIRGIAASMGLHYRTVERYVRSGACPDWSPGRRRPSRLDRFESYIVQRLRHGCRNARQILRELQGMGYRGGRTAVRVYVRRLETESGAPDRPANPPALAPRAFIPSARKLAVSAVRRPDGRSAEDRRCLDVLGEDDGEIGEAIELAGKFAALIRGRLPGDLTAWLTRAEASSVAGLRSFARRLRQDEAAVRAGATVEWSNGPVEGQVNRLKVIKRSMYGRAGFDLLKARVLHAV